MFARKDVSFARDGQRRYDNLCRTFTRAFRGL